MTKAVVLLSGGLDSATALAITKALGLTPFALSFRYGQRHGAEIEAAKAVAAHLGVAEHRIVDIDLRAFGGSALTADIAVPEHRKPADMATGVPITYVPARNTIFLAYALAWAEVLEATEIVIGVNAVDYSGYPDCRPEYIAAFQAMANLATKAATSGRKTTIHAPLIWLSKAEIIRRGLALGVDYSLTRSCYQLDEEGRSCGRCDSCRIRQEGFAAVGVADAAISALGTRHSALGTRRTDGVVTYSVKEIYYTLQGEGAQTGRAAVFCRFAGCNLWTGREADRGRAICQFCDTDFFGIDGEGGGKYAEAEALADRVAAEWPASGDRAKRYVVCTGGEPLLQLDGALIDAFHRRGFEIGVETNGTIAVPAGVDWVCVSPKAGAELVVPEGNELKLVYPQPGLMPDRVNHLTFGHFFLQPMDGPSRDLHIRQAIGYCLAHPQWRLSLQTHKLTGLR